MSYWENSSLLEKVKGRFDLPWLCYGMRVEASVGTGIILDATEQGNLLLQLPERVQEWHPKDRITYLGEDGKVIADFWYRSLLEGKVVRMDQNIIGMESSFGTLILPQEFYGFILYNSGWKHGLVFPKYSRIHKCGPFWYERDGTIACKGILSHFHAGMCLKVSRRILEEEGVLAGIS